MSIILLKGEIHFKHIWQVEEILFEEGLTHMSSLYQPPVAQDIEVIGSRVVSDVCVEAGVQ